MGRVILLVGAVVSALFAGSAPAAGNPAAPAQAPAPVGEVRASAYGLRLAPAIGGTALTFTFGGAGALLQNAAGTGVAAAVDLGLLGTVFSSGACGFSSPYDVPGPMVITNTEGDRSESADVVPAGGVVGVGSQSVTVTTEPRVDASATFSGVTIESAVELSGVEASAEAYYGETGAPVGHSVVTTDLVVGGVLELRGLRWEVRQEGADPGAGTGSFSYTGGSVLGAPIPAGDAGDLESAVNPVLAPFGLRVEAPTLRQTEGSTPVTAMTPLVVGYGGSPLLNTVLDPLLGLSRELKEQLVEFIASSCFSSYGGLIADLAIGLVIGTGNLDVLVGGVQVSTNDDQFVDPFGTPTLPPVETVDDVLAPSGTTPAGGPSTPPPTAGRPAAATPGRPSTVSQGAAQNVSAVCETVHPIGSPLCSRGAAVVAGAVAVVGMAGLAAADLAVRRRRRTLELDAEVDP